MGDYTTAGAVEVALVDRDDVDEEGNPGAIWGRIEDGAALPAGCDELGRALEALPERLRTILEDCDDDADRASVPGRR